MIGQSISPPVSHLTQCAVNGHAAEVDRKNGFPFMLAMARSNVESQVFDQFRDGEKHGIQLEQISIRRRLTATQRSAIQGQSPVAGAVLDDPYDVLPGWNRQ